MGLLTDPGSSQQKSKYAKLLIKVNRRLCLFLYLLGLGWFCLLSHKEFNHATYFSENALLPGLVYSEIKTDNVNYALNLYDELERERESHKTGTPHAWLLSKMRQIGLDTYSHNFTLNYPLGGGKTFTGKNVYGILRAPRIGSTESFVITAPYRPPDSIHPEITHSIPLLLAFANFARNQKYWAKDIIFLITEQEQLGMQAWLQAYHGTEENDVLKSGTLDATAGSIQAAINLEIQNYDIDFIDVKIEGLNGQLPNLDLVNLVQRLTLKEGISCGHRQTSNKRRSALKSKLEENLAHMVSMVLTQATGVPNGNHGLFHRYGIEALTLEGHKSPSTNYQRRTHGAASLLRLIEGISRSLNNLLERFHQSYFFYLLVASDRFVSIGDYMPSVAAMAGALLIKAFIVWLTINKKEDNDDAEQQNLNFNFVGVGKFLIVAHAIGFLLAYLPFITQIDHGVKTEQFIFYEFVTITNLTLVIPFFVLFSSLSVQILHIAALLELGTVLIIIGMVNFSLALLLCVFVVPFAILVNPAPGSFKNVHRAVSIIYHPLLVTFASVLGVTVYTFHELPLPLLMERAFKATMNAITFSIVDSIIYGNWIFDLVTVIFVPVWIIFWTSLMCRQQDDVVVATKEKDE
ncbi:glycosylphosphatidylinositol anchor attachment 1 protein [Bradysia coprophila]|uniref:glycosylphosphatidylinositol anchor attachment 1 protein n=1 Tax=Bradysia coprophila TaxID=38358 RepID=UPI00187D712B|nr:glycosylphosphatidylinositol anchor attachment 1 protein [Bradysia coprophila]